MTTNKLHYATTQKTLSGDEVRIERAGPDIDSRKGKSCILPGIMIITQDCIDLRHPIPDLARPVYLNLSPTEALDLVRDILAHIRDHYAEKNLPALPPLKKK